MIKKRAMSSDKARLVRKQGHDDAREFALLIGLSNDYKNDIKAKKDVIDPSGDAHSVKSGKKRWQIFLYSLNRIKNDDFFQTMNGIGQLLEECINSFPENYYDYLKDKIKYKELLRIPMRKLSDLLQEKRRLRSFINKAMFNGGEVDYLTVKHDNIFHVFHQSDVVKVFSDNIVVENSKAHSSNQMSELKVIFRHNDHNIGELEVRNSGENHYREILFIMNKLKVLELLFGQIKNKIDFEKTIVVYGKAIKKFGNWISK